ncbi:hypothetical protein [Methylorubrum extorquens]
MSNDGGMRVWVGDLDGYINLDAIDWANDREAEEEALLAELDKIGNLALLAGKSISAHSVNARGVSPSEWRWAMHEADKQLAPLLDAAGFERALVRALSSMGRPYAIARYAQWERVPKASALTAALPYGFKALLTQYLQAEGLQRTDVERERIRTTLSTARDAQVVNAYERVGMLQTALHELAYHVKGSHGPRRLDQEGTRMILSLARLHFAVAESRVECFREIVELNARYEAARHSYRSGEDEYRPVVGRHLKNWRARHLRPLSDLYPFSIRHALARGANSGSLSGEHARTIAMNELALAHCGILLMRRNARGRARAS